MEEYLNGTFIEATLKNTHTFLQFYSSEVAEHRKQPAKPRLSYISKPTMNTSIPTTVLYFFFHLRESLL